MAREKIYVLWWIKKNMVSVEKCERLWPQTAKNLLQIPKEVQFEKNLKKNVLQVTSWEAQRLNSS